jgi:hypothetical protein
LEHERNRRSEQIHDSRSLAIISEIFVIEINCIGAFHRNRPDFAVGKKRNVNFTRRATGAYREVDRFVISYVSSRLLKMER